jgi:hypothetical protein
MDTTVGSGRVITMPVITEDGQPIEDPNSNGGARASSAGVEQQTSNATLPKEVIQWKLLLHQIGKQQYCLSFQHLSVAYIVSKFPFLLILPLIYYRSRC